MPRCPGKLSLSCLILVVQSLHSIQLAHPAHSLPFTPSLSPRYTHTRIHTRRYIHVVIARPKMHNMKARHADMEHPSAEKLLARAKACPKCLCFPGRRPGRRAHLPRKSLEDVNPFRKFKRSNFFSYNLRLPGFCVGGVHVFQDGFRTSSRKTQAFGTCAIYHHTRSLSKSIIVSVKADQMSTGTYLFRSSGFMQEASKLEHVFKENLSRTTVGGIYSSHSASAPFPLLNVEDGALPKPSTLKSRGEGRSLVFSST